MHLCNPRTSMTTAPATAKGSTRSSLCGRVCLLLALCGSVFFPLLAPAVEAQVPPDAVMPDGGRYYGPLVEGLRQGTGKIEWDSGVHYEGRFERGLYSGPGELKQADGRSYKGEFSRGLYHGKGVYSSPDGQVYEGNFDKGEFTGTGLYKRADGTLHQGQFIKWRPHGAGTYTDATGNVFEGNFVDGALNGPGRMVGKKGMRYEGEFKNWQFEGEGVLHYANGDAYKGAFAEGVFEGQGTFTFAKPQKDGTSTKTGVWRYGILPDKAAAQRVATNVETALYSQRSLLNAALASLSPSQSDKINMYLLAVAGDGSQEVFRRETAFVQDQFDRDFQTLGRSLVLANSRNTVSLLPMATLTSVRESIDAIASRMDKNKDILFLYLSSHGSADHQLTLDQDGMNLRNLGAKDLGAMLKASGIRWKVIVVSACYAGGFIEPLQDERTLVIAAARADRRSFGCADENDFTYFGRAFFKESLPSSTAFSAAFGRAKALVQKWEDDDFKEVSNTDENEHSEPQISTSPLVEQYLKRWRDGLAKTQP